MCILYVIFLFVIIISEIFYVEIRVVSNSPIQETEVDIFIVVKLVEEIETVSRLGEVYWYAEFFSRSR